MSSTYADPLEVLEHGLDDLARIDPGYRTVSETKDALVRLSRIAARVEAERMRVLAAADDVAFETGARSTVHWLTEALDATWTAVGAALASGAVNVSQAHVIVAALEALPATLDPDLRIKAEAHLISEAGHFGPQQLKRIGLGLLEVIAPEIADEAEYQRLVAEEKRSRAETRLTTRDRGDRRLVRSPPLQEALVPRCKTDLADGKLLCPFHHHRAHDPAWQTHQ